MWLVDSWETSVVSRNVELKYLYQLSKEKIKKYIWDVIQS